MASRPVKPSGKKTNKLTRVRHIALRDVYIKACAEVGQNPNSAVVEFFSMNPVPSTIEYIDLSQNYVGDKGIVPLMAVVDRCHNLRELNIRENGLRNKAITALCNSAVKHPSLQSINVSDNYISEGAAVQLQRLLEDNPRVCELGIDNTKIEVEWRVKLRDLVRANHQAMLKANVMLSPKRLKLDKAISTAHKNIFAFLLCVNEERHIHATLRVAGGWVRDALLGLHSQDIDIAIESPESKRITGEVFAREVSAYQEAMGMTARTVSVIRVNPELSKHIETATVCVFDTPIEFCALRHDEYTNPNSRIPVVRPATALEDALRRDYTINALFYNLHTMEVEDYTTGLQDLQCHLLRCPLDPAETFADDPLRLLRGIRFVGQLGELGFSLDESIMQCVNKDLLEKIKIKVSRERIGKELVKMLSGSFPEKCVEILFRMGILQHVLLAEIYMKSGNKGKVSAEVDSVNYLVANDTVSGSLESLLALNRTLTPLFSRNGSPLLLTSSFEKLVALLFLLLLPFYRSVPREQLPDRLYALCLNGLKLSLAVYNSLRRMIECYQTLVQHRLDVSSVSGRGVVKEAKLTVFESLGELNDKKVISSAFKIVLSVYLVLEDRGDLLQSNDVEAVAKLIKDVWFNLEREPGLLDAMSRPLPLKGDEISKLISLDPRKIGSALLELRRYALLHPQASRDDMITWLREKKDTL